MEALSLDDDIAPLELEPQHVPKMELTVKLYPFSKYMKVPDSELLGMTAHGFQVTSVNDIVGAHGLESRTIILRQL